MPIIATIIYLSGGAITKDEDRWWIRLNDSNAAWGNDRYEICYRLRLIEIKPAYLQALYDKLTGKNYNRWDPFSVKRMSALVLTESGTVALSRFPRRWCNSVRIDRLVVCGPGPDIVNPLVDTELLGELFINAEAIYFANCKLTSFAKELTTPCFTLDVPSAGNHHRRQIRSPSGRFVFHCPDTIKNPEALLSSILHLHYWGKRAAPAPGGGS